MSRFVLSVLPVALTLSACVLDDGYHDGHSDGLGGTEIGVDRHSLNTTNDMSHNRIALNRIALNRIALNRIALNSLDGLEADEGGRELLKYLAQCALEDGDILVATHEGIEYEFPGRLGLAPGWENDGLGVRKQQLVSACLLAHVNAYGVSVMISVRSYPLVGADPIERRDYAVYEGTFFGQVFQGESLPLLTYACQGDEPAIARVQSSDRERRACTDPSDDCAIVSVGRCRDVCEIHDDKHGWRNCWADGDLYEDTVSVYLRADDPYGENTACGVDGNCNLSCGEDHAAIIDCSHGNNCTAICERNGVCLFDGAGANNFHSYVRGMAIAEIDCLDTNNCRAACESDSSCEIDCKGANNCRQIYCAADAACLLDCTDAADCGFQSCAAGAMTCPGDIIVCGRGCP